MKIDFSTSAWEASLDYAYTRRFDTIARFDQEPDCIVNRANPALPFGYDNISLVTREKYGSGTRIMTRCSFEAFGAPLIMMAKDLYRDENGNLRFDDYYEVVLWERGINVWRLWHDGKDPSNNGMTWALLMGVDFPVAGGEAHELQVAVKGKQLEIEVDGHKMSLLTEGMFDSFYVGIDACEGINRFYELEVEADG